MQILITTFGLLLILSLVTFIGLQKHEEANFLEIVAHHHFQNMQDELKETLSDIADDQYAALIKNEKPPKNTPRGGKHLCRFLNIGPLFFDEKDEDGEKKQTIRIVLKRLIQELYSNQEFYKEEHENLPDFDEIFINELISASKNQELLTGKKKMKDVSDLGKYQLHDKGLDHFLYAIMRGDKLRHNLTSRNGQYGYYSLANFVRANKSEKPLSVYLAPRPVLMALYQSQEIVDNIMETRNQICSTLSGDISQKEKLGLEFKNLFSGLLPDDIHTIELSFNVSSTKPFE